MVQKTIYTNECLCSSSAPPPSPQKDGSKFNSDGSHLTCSNVSNHMSPVGHPVKLKQQLLSSCDLLDEDSKSTASANSSPHGLENQEPPKPKVLKVESYRTNDVSQLKGPVVAVHNFSGTQCNSEAAS